MWPAPCIPTVPQLFLFHVESLESVSVGNPSDGTACLMRGFLQGALNDVGNIQPWRGDTQWGVMRDRFQHPVGRVSVHSIPNSHTARVDVLFHNVTCSRSALSAVRLVLRDRGGLQQVAGTWEQAPVLRCCFTVPRDRSLELAVGENVEPPRQSGEWNVCSMTLDQAEQIQECLERRARGGR